MSDYRPFTPPPRPKKGKRYTPGERVTYHRAPRAGWDLEHEPCPATVVRDTGKQTVQVEYEYHGQRKVAWVRWENLEVEHADC